MCIRLSHATLVWVLRNFRPPQAAAGRLQSLRQIWRFLAYIYVDGAFQACLSPTTRILFVSSPALARPRAPPQDAGVEVGDTLQQVDGVLLGSYKQGMAVFKKQKGSFKLTVLREDDITI